MAALVSLTASIHTLLFAAALDATIPDLHPSHDRYPEATYLAKAGFDGEIFPAFANFVSLQDPSDREWSVVAVTVSNPTSEILHERIAVRIEGWSDEEIQGVEINVG